LIASAEAAGKLPEALKELLETKRRVRRVVTAFRNAMIRPAVYTATIYLVVWAIGKYAIPQMALVFPASQATGVTAGLFWTGAMAQTLWALVPPMTLALIGWLVTFSLPRWRGRWRVAAEDYFPYSYYRDTHGYLWLSRYITLWVAGTPDVEILKQQLRYASPYIKERLLHFRRVMEDGKSFPQALLMPQGKNGKPFGFPNPDVVDDIESFDGLGDFADRMKSVLRDWVEDLEEQTLEKAAKFGFLLEIAMYVVMGLLMYGINDISTHAHF
jgi:type II secretory pathway component PulF